MILETKLQPPALKPNTLRRERLLKLLKNHLQRKLVLMTGDAGYGKTTLLAQVMKEEGLPCVFYDLDEGDSDLVVFASYLVHGLERIQPGLASRMKGLLEQGGEAGRNHELLFGTLINELVEKRKEELFLILDDYHGLPEDSPVHQALDYFIDHLPDIVHVILASRTIPPLPSLSKWRAKQDLFELTKEGLKFTDKEVKALLSEVYKLVLSEEELRRVGEQTEGWITGIQLILQSAGKDGKTVKETMNGYLEAHQPLFEYFANEIYSRESPEVQEFLRKSSILDRLTPEACNSLLGKGDAAELLKEYGASPGSEGSDSERLLKDLEKRNLFVSSVGQGQYKYHRLFREFLRSQIKDESFRKALHLKAADHYQRTGQLERAIEHYLEAGSHEWAGKVIALVADEMENQVRFNTLVSWFRKIPEEVLDGQPRLLIILGNLCQDQGRLEEAEEKFNRAEAAFKSQGDFSALTSGTRQRGVLLWIRGDYAESLKVLRRALKTCPPQETKRRAQILQSIGADYLKLGDFRKARTAMRKAYALYELAKDDEGRIVVRTTLASLVSLQGETRAALAEYRKLTELVGDKYFYSVGVVFSNAARTAIEMNEVGWAEQVLERGRTLCKPYEDPHSQAAFHFGFGVLETQTAQWESASRHLKKAVEEYRSLGWPWAEANVLKDLACLYRLQGDLVKSQKHLDLAFEKAGSPGSSLETALFSEQALLEVARGRIDQAEQTIKRGLRLTAKWDLRGRVVFLLLARVGVYLSKRKKKEAAHWFLRAVRMSIKKGYDGILLRELSHSPRLLKLAESMALHPPKKGVNLSYLRGILMRCGT